MKHKIPYAFVSTALWLALALPAALGQPPAAALSGQQESSQNNRPVHTYRVTFTVTESDSGKRVGVQHYAMTAVPNQITSMKQGTKIPVLTGTSQEEPQSSKASTAQFTYIDVGLNCSATLTETPDGVEAAIKLYQSSVAEKPDLIGGVAEPVIRQTVLESASVLRAGVPVMIGSLDVPGSTRHLDIEVKLEALS